MAEYMDMSEQVNITSCSTPLDEEGVDLAIERLRKERLRKLIRNRNEVLDRVREEQLNEFVQQEADTSSRGRF